MMDAFHFLRPEWLYGFPVLFVLLWLYKRRKAESRSWQSVCDPALLLHLLVRQSEGRRVRTVLPVLFFSGLLGIIALSGPVWDQLEQPVFRKQSAWVIVLDLSRSMDAGDVAPTRLTRARHKLVDILKQRGEGQTALIVYAAAPFVVSPLTQDAGTIIAQVSALKTELMPRQGSRPDLALKKAGLLLRQAGVARGRVLLISDGLENVSRSSLENAVSTLKNQGHRLSILGVGSLQGAPITLPNGGFLKDDKGVIVIPKLNELVLLQLARLGGGSYARLSVTEADITKLFAEETAERFETKTEDTGMTTDRWREEGPWLLLPLLPIAALAFRRGVLAAFLLFLILAPVSVHALEWDSLWLRQDQRAAGLFENQDLSAAAALFEDPEWKAASHYRAGDYEKSIVALEGLDHPDALYNRGNALAQLGRLPEALQAYDAALQGDPEHADARYNREQVKEQLDQQAQENQQKQKGDGRPQEGEERESDQSGEGQENQVGQQSVSDSEAENKPGADGQEQSDARSSQDDERDNFSKPNEKQDAEQQENREDVEDKGALSDSQRAELGEQDESQLANEQWLRRIPDDPGGLLRRKFYLQAQKSGQNMQNEEKAW